MGNHGKSIIIKTKLGIEVIHVESDVQEVRNLVVHDHNENKPLMHLIVECRKRRLDFKKCKINHVFREANKVADYLVNKALFLEGLFFQLLNHLGACCLLSG